MLCAVTALIQVSAVMRKVAGESRMVDRYFLVLRFRLNQEVLGAWDSSK